MSAAPPPHGGNVYELAQALGLEVRDLLDFSANINPLGMPEGARRAALEAWPELGHYPDTHCLELREALAAYHGLDPTRILVGNGSTELIYLLARALNPRQALIVTPAFSEYERALRVSQVPVAFHATSEDRYFTLSQAPDPQGADLVFLANPASPSGALLPPDELSRIIAALEAAGAYPILDEAFIDFVEAASLKSRLRDFARLLILRSFTKFFGIPGIRLGYLLAAPELVQRLAAVQEPWSVNTLAQAMGRACLEDLDYMKRTREFISQEKEYLYNRLRALPGLLPFPSQVNYLLVKLIRPGLTTAGLQAMMLAHRIVIRDASNFRGLDERFFRVAVRLRAENDRLLEALEMCLPDI